MEGRAAAAAAEKEASRAAVWEARAALAEARLLVLQGRSAGAAAKLRAALSTPGWAESAGKAAEQAQLLLDRITNKRL